MSNLQDDITTTLGEYLAQRPQRGVTLEAVDAPDPWRLCVTLQAASVGQLRLRSLRPGDDGRLAQLRETMSPASRKLFGPYPWQDDAALPDALRQAVANSVSQTDAAYLVEKNDTCLGNFFLWKARHNPVSAAVGLHVPELGIGLADVLHGRGLGGLLMRLLAVAARELHADAIELTTALDNQPGFETYKRAGYEYVGDVWNPLAVDVAAVAAGEVRADKWGVERQMVLVLVPEKRAAVLDFLARKRQRFEEMARQSGADTAAG